MQSLLPVSPIPLESRNYRQIMSTLPCLEFVAGPQCPVITVASRLRVLQKTTCIKNPVIALKPKVRVDLPSHFHARSVSNKPFATTVCGSN